MFWGYSMGFRLKGSGFSVWGLGPSPTDLLHSVVYLEGQGT